MTPQEYMIAIDTWLEDVAMIAVNDHNRVDVLLDRYVNAFCLPDPFDYYDYVLKEKEVLRNLTSQFSKTNPDHLDFNQFAIEYLLNALLENPHD